MKHNRRSTLFVSDIISAAALAGKTLTRHEYHTGNKYETRKKRIKDDEKKDAVKKARRMHPGTVSLREIRRAQKSTKLIFPFRSFERVVREVLQNHIADVRLADNVSYQIQCFIEDLLISLLQNATLLTIHASRVRLTVQDIYVAYNMSGKLTV
jgi:histone H3/H4